MFLIQQKRIGVCKVLTIVEPNYRLYYIEVKEKTHLFGFCYLRNQNKRKQKLYLIYKVILNTEIKRNKFSYLQMN